MADRSSEKSYTRRISPWLGLLGLLGFLGFLGFLDFTQLGAGAAVQPCFLFFGFFGFFGFYYEGKMSATLMDERFIANRNRAAAAANRIALTGIVLAAILSVSVLRLEVKQMLDFLMASIGLFFALALFLQQYLLYRFDAEQ